MQQKKKNALKSDSPTEKKNETETYNLKKYLSGNLKKRVQRSKLDILHHQQIKKKLNKVQQE